MKALLLYVAYSISRFLMEQNYPRQVMTAWHIWIHLLFIFFDTTLFLWHSITSNTEDYIQQQQCFNIDIASRREKAKAQENGALYNLSLTNLYSFLRCIPARVKRNWILEIQFWFKCLEWINVMVLSILYPLCNVIQKCNQSCK